MAGRTFLMDGEAISNDEQCLYSDEDDTNEEGEEEEEDEIEYMHTGVENSYEQEDEDEEFHTLTEDNVPVMPTGFYSNVENFLNKPPPGLAKDAHKQGEETGGEKRKKKKTKKGLGDQIVKREDMKSLPVIHDMPKVNVPSKVSTRRGPGLNSKKSSHKVLDERLLQQAFEYSNKLQQEAMVEEVYEASLLHGAAGTIPQKSSSAPQLRPQEQGAKGVDFRSKGGGGSGSRGVGERKPRSADHDFNVDSASATSRQASHSTSSTKGQGQGRKKTGANSVVRRLRSKTQTNVRGLPGSGKPPRSTASSSGFDTSCEAESGTSTRNITDFQSLVSNFEHGTHLEQLKAELEQSKASMAESRRAMQDISKEMSGKLRI